MSDIEQRMAEIIKREYDKGYADIYPMPQALAAALVAELGLMDGRAGPALIG